METKYNLLEKAGLWNYCTFQLYDYCKLIMYSSLSFLTIDWIKKRERERKYLIFLLSTLFETVRNFKYVT